MDELLEQFVLESRELVQLAVDDLLALEQAPDDATHVDSAFRAVHTLKGSVGLFAFEALGTVLHAAEDLLGGLRDGVIIARPATMDALLACMNTIDAWIDAIATTESLPQGAEAVARDLAEALRRAMGGRGAAAVSVQPGVVDDEPGWLTALRARDAASARAGHGILTGIRYIPGPDCFFLGDDPLALVRAVPELVALQIRTVEPWVLAAFEPYRCNLVIEALSAASIDTVRQIFRFVSDQVVITATRPTAIGLISSPERAGDGTQPLARVDPAYPALRVDAAQRTLRVDASRIDALANLVGELFVAKNRLSHLAAEAAVTMPSLARALAANHADIDRLVGDMHRAVTGTRLTPLGQAFRRLPRVVREIAGKLGKEIRFEINGAGTEADKSIVDALFEPLLHVLRNALDHGIELPSQRQAAGKAPQGLITLSGWREGEKIVVTVQDDGAGIDTAAIRRTAAARGLLDAASVAGLDDAGAMDLIFLPGFSTAASVTAVSGRGVGMDAVRTALDAIGGRVGITGTPGAGTCVRFVVPQAVAVTTIVIVNVGDERFGIPMEVIAETVRIPRAHTVPVRDGVAFVLRDQTIPLLRLSDLLGRDGPDTLADAKILVATLGGNKIGIEVDGFAARMDVVLHPLHGLLAGLPGMHGTALLGDGHILLVLDLAELVG